MLSRQVHPYVVEYLLKFGLPINTTIDKASSEIHFSDYEIEIDDYLAGFDIVNVELLHFPDECQTGLNLISKIVLVENNRHIFQVCGRKEDVQTAVERGRAIVRKRLMDCMKWS